MTVQDAAIEHDDLLRAARNLYILSGIGEMDALAFAAAGFLGKLETHLQEEAADFVRLAPGDARALSEGHRRLVGLARSLNDLTRTGCSEAGGPRRERFEELLARCFVQVRDEGLILQRHADGRSPQGSRLLDEAKK